MKTAILCAALVLAAGAAMAQPSDPFTEALSQVGMTADDLRFDQDEMATWQGDRWRLDYFTLYHKNPLRLPQHAELIQAELGAHLTNLPRLLAFAGRRIDQPIRRGLIGDQLAQYAVQADSLPLFSITGKRNVLLGPEFASLRDGIDLFYRLIDDKQSLFRQAVNEIDDDGDREKLWEFFLYDSTKHLDKVEELYERLDMGRMVGGAQDIAEALQRLADTLPWCTFPDYVVEISTGHGNIYVGTPEDDDFEYVQAPLLIVDGGGNDTYRFTGENTERPIAAIVDLSGDDMYISEDTTKPGIGGAVIGLSIVIDRAGNDRYTGHHLCQGGGLFGVGAVLDYAGNDIYASRYLSQGAGAFGLGILSDSSGADSLYCWSMAQGFGFTHGCGLVLNGAGADRYVAEDDTLFSAASQTGEHNNSLAQGVGFGRRADFLDGHSWAGGFGLLCDLSGDDRYQAGLFAQGCAYWFSVGMLLDGSGADSYSGIWYVQGAGAHFGVAYLDDFGGDDVYTATDNMAVGAGHDFTIGYLNERGGNDIYTVPNLSLGGGNANGIGIFHDHTGDDTYATKAGSTTLGRANGIDSGIRGVLHCFGVFIDGAGADSYREDWAGNNSRWIGPPSNAESPNPTAIGVGIDLE
ncbi:hypothetical protein GF420_10580 [candidate division GN15 bacterium]|nr:hypothetical protein [candidate division GN15 bacterium]